MTDYAEKIDAEGIKEAVGEVFKELFSKSGAVLKDVFVSDDYDHDGDPILRVLIVFESKDGKLDPLGMMRFRRHLFEPLTKLNEDGFPVVRFITKADKEERDAEIKAEAEQVARKMFEGRFSKKGATLTNVSFRDKRDSDGDQILQVKISYDAKGVKLDPSEIMGFERDLRYFMGIIDDYRLPHIKIVSEAKKKKLQEETGHATA